MNPTAGLSSPKNAKKSPAPKGRGIQSRGVPRSAKRHNSITRKLLPISEVPVVIDCDDPLEELDFPDNGLAVEDISSPVDWPPSVLPGECST